MRLRFAYSIIFTTMQHIYTSLLSVFEAICPLSFTSLYAVAVCCGLTFTVQCHSLVISGCIKLLSGFTGGLNISNAYFFSCFKPLCRCEMSSLYLLSSCLAFQNYSVFIMTALRHLNTLIASVFVMPGGSCSPPS
ncbi:hypothetical protein AMECASPLE_024325 [Ameca splendens]|uniref:Uncharacterized protein n=1 Tax=Ameca splendens TaxID=208324 RepID=A0ABV1ABI3_9TELE